MQCMSCVVSRIFVGDDFEERHKWRQIAAAYIGSIFQCHHVMRAWPHWSRPYIHWFLPQLQEARKMLKTINAILDPHVQERVSRREERIRQGEMLDRSKDAVDWILDQV